MKKLLFLFTILCSFGTSAQVFDKIKLTESEISAGYKLTDEPQCISIQACTFYKNPKMYDFLIGKVKSKEVQNFVNGNDSGSIMYFEFENQFDKETFLEGLFWGGKKATQEHPEQILVKDKILIVYSFPLENDLIKVSQKKVESVLK
jgi:hypothetical protein